MKETRKTNRIGLRIEDSLFYAATKKAESIGLSLSSYIRMLMTIDINNEKDKNT